jgi:hypothetical protein
VHVNGRVGRAKLLGQLRDRLEREVVPVRGARHHMAQEAPFVGADVDAI